MCIKKSKNNLKELMMSLKISNAELCSILNVGESAVKSYLNGNRSLPLEHGLELAEKYNVTLDWLYGRSEYPNECDIMGGILLSLSKVLSVKEDPKSGYPVLYIDRQFCDYLREINIIRYEKDLGQLPEEWFIKQLEVVHFKYKEYITSLFGHSEFNADHAVQIAFSEDLIALEYLSSAWLKE